MSTYIKRSESSLVTSVMNYLQILENSGKIAFWNRQQAGSVAISPIWKIGKHKIRKIRLGREGVSDLWCIPRMSKLFCNTIYPMIWIECKTDNGKQSPIQIEFQKIVQNCGHYYWIIHNCTELENKFKEICVI